MVTTCLLPFLLCVSPTYDLVQSPVDEPVVLNDEVIFPLTVSLDKLPVNTLKVKVRAKVEVNGFADVSLCFLSLSAICLETLVRCAQKQLSDRLYFVVYKIKMVKACIVQ